MFRVDVDCLLDYLSLDPIRADDLRKLDKLVASAMMLAALCMLRRRTLSRALIGLLRTIALASGQSR
jgi:hypothetical protein